MHGHGDTLDPVNQLVIHVHREICRLVRILVTCPYLVVNEQAEVRIVDLDDAGT